jgi:hypothetical protein
MTYLLRYKSENTIHFPNLTRDTSVNKQKICVLPRVHVLLTILEQITIIYLNSIYQVTFVTEESFL